MSGQEDIKKNDLNDYIKELVIARINALSDNLEISVGGENVTKQAILKSIKEGNELGQEVIEMQLKFLRDMADGKIYQNE